MRKERGDRKEGEKEKSVRQGEGREREEVNEDDAKREND